MYYLSSGSSRHGTDIISQHPREEEMSDLIAIFKKTKRYHLDGNQLFPPQPKRGKEPVGLNCRKDLEMHLEEVPFN